MDADDLAVREAFGQRVQGETVIWIVEGWDKDQGVSNVEVGVACRQALAFEEDGRGHGQACDFEGLAVEIASGFQACKVLGEGEMIFVCGVGFDGGDDAVGSNEARDVVDVAVGVVAGAAAMQPESLADAEVIVKGLFQLLARDARVALLNLREQALFGCDENAFAVDVDRSAFEDEAVLASIG